MHLVELLRDIEYWYNLAFDSLNVVLEWGTTPIPIYTNIWEPVYVAPFDLFFGTMLSLYLLIKVTRWLTGIVT